MAVMEKVTGEKIARSVILLIPEIQTRIIGRCNYLPRG
jgi:hypothetical protein